uniref:Uncharacterized protein n=1 Tax=Pararge aegeria TaxID=116150 RepID=S4P8G2_9NEOP
MRCAHHQSSLGLAPHHRYSLPLHLQNSRLNHHTIHPSRPTLDAKHDSTYSFRMNLSYRGFSIQFSKQL